MVLRKLAGIFACALMIGVATFAMAGVPDLEESTAAPAFNGEYEDTFYRGLATAIVGGMTFSLFFTLLMLPSLLRIGSVRQADRASTQHPQNSTLESVA